MLGDSFHFSLLICLLTMETPAARKAEETRRLNPNIDDDGFYKVGFITGQDMNFYSFSMASSSPFYFNIPRLRHKNVISLLSILKVFISGH